MENFINTSIAKIREAKKTNKLVLFVGAGVSSNSNLPSWNELINHFAKELGISIKKSNDDYLKIPQLFYNERGEKEYYDKIYSVFSKTLKPNWIHKELFKLLPSTIITTNYDSLLEDSASFVGQHFHTIRKDQDIPYTNNDKMIIKMHGDLVTRNIVLKEDDYLSYSNNFKLIETLIKSIFTSKVVLFIGYSASDYDFKLIFQSVKDILKESFQPAYLLDVFNKYDRLEFEYFRKKGINILYYSQIMKQINKIESKYITYTQHETQFIKPLTLIGDNLNRFIFFINNEEYSNIVDKYYFRLKPFFNLAYIKNKDIKTIFDSVDFRTDYYLLILNTELIAFFERIKKDKKYRKEVLVQNSSKIRKIIHCLKKSNVKGFASFNNILFKWENRINDSITDSIEDLYISNNWIELENNLLSLRQDVSTKDAEINDIGIAFYNYKLGNFSEAYSVLKDISIKAFYSKKYLVYFLSEFNKKKLSGPIQNHLLRIKRKDELLKRILEEIELINIDDIIQNIPSNELKQIMVDISNLSFVYERHQEIDKRIGELEGHKKTVDLRGISINNTFNIAYHNFIDLWFYINRNYIFVEHFSEVKFLYQKFIRGIFLSYYLANKPLIDTFGIFSRNSSDIQKFNFWLLWLIIEYVETNYLKDLLDELSIISIKLENEKIKDDLIQTFISLLNYIENKDYQTKEANYGRINRYFIVFSRIQLNVEQRIKVLSFYFNKPIFYLNPKPVYFYTLLKEGLNDVLDNNILSFFNEIIHNLLKIILETDLSPIYLENLLSEEVFYELCPLLRNREEKFYLDAEVLSILIEKIRMRINKGINDKDIKILCEIIYQFKDYLPNKTTVKLKSFIPEILENLLNNDAREYYDLFYFSVIYDIFKPTVQQILQYIDTIINKVKLNNERPNNARQNNPYVDQISNLLILGKIRIQSITDEAKNLFQNESIFFKFVISPKTFDYNLFDPFWIRRITPKYYKIIKQNKNNLQIIRSVINNSSLLSNEKVRLIELFINKIEKIK